MNTALEIDPKFVKAGNITAKVRDEFKRRNLIGMTVTQVCTEVEDMIRKLGAEPGFPCGVSINDVTAHYSGELFEDRVITDNSVIKLDLGAHIDGFVADTAVTISYNPDYYELTLATEKVLYEAIKNVKHRTSSATIGKIIEETAHKYGFKPISNLSGHSIERFKIHAGISIPNISTPFGSNLNIGHVYAIEPFLTLKNAAGYVVDGTTKTIYMLIRRKHTGDKKLDNFTDTIWKTRNTLPFSPRWYLDNYSKEELNEILNKLVARKIFRVYPDLIEATNAIVAQFEHTITPTEDGAVILTET
ncbi:MAG: type II methionyl aminopeptidase [Thaumarchaeota archaeon]|nr:type II methionyl aminopeptidase [Nitrososphaerota archaeon]|tara:strand:+ start:6949 stop:7857 length:909 start_codon:yes stop_codon:yes gene_type:complete